ncbi:hypothetical protein JI721_10735 [Alicyclobacillus cycloheptanicus]|uniref:Sensory rhodopsin transducer n=1 Tax=Alicyclobacillus cycloheptanicus TaxID=1457 RepID=A0ABT9XFL0_9BACL|nr:sensory rhodopsin transducer [Alicyclobacillus cycloheptanicus]MDQ0189088.1 hypothetical protein [Alicyclobacillus cycloheptanicus]WDM00222.1 hypothetical protein JI721_10735 [Alicyclobacillus cycloheptanicus]
MFGKHRWVIPDGYLPAKSTGDQTSHETVSVLNLTTKEALLRITIYFEDRDPITGLQVRCGGERTRHIRLDEISTADGETIPRGVPYAIVMDSDVPVIVQHSRLDTSQEALALFTTMAYSE